MIKVKEIVATLIPIIIGGLIALVIKTFLVTAIIVDGSSMAPNLYANETVVLLRHAQVKRNQIVVFKAAGVDKNNHYLKPNTLYIKRVIGMPGDRIRYSKQGNLYINGCIIFRTDNVKFFCITVLLLFSPFLRQNKRDGPQRQSN